MKPRILIRHLIWWPVVGPSYIVGFVWRVVRDGFHAGAGTGFRFVLWLDPKNND